MVLVSFLELMLMVWMDFRKLDRVTRLELKTPSVIWSVSVSVKTLKSHIMSEWMQQV